MTPLSLVPEQARHLGMSYPELVHAIVEDALSHLGVEDALARFGVDDALARADGRTGVA